MRVCKLLAIFVLISGLLLGALPAAQAVSAQGRAGSGPGKPQPGAAIYTATPVDGLPAKLAWTVAFDPQDRPWVGTNRGGATLQDNGEWRRLAQADGLSDDSVKSYLFAPANRMWVGTGRGLNLFVDGKLERIFTWSDGLASSGVEDLALDAGGALWAAHLAEGASRFDGEQWRKVTTEDGLADNWVYSIAPDAEGHLWFGTGAGASRFDGAGWQTYTGEDGLAGDWVSEVAAAPDGDVWFATDGGVSQFDGETWTTHLAGRAARAVAVAADGAVWAAGSGFVSSWDGAAWREVQPAYFDNQLLLALAPRANGEVWVASLEDGVTILTPATAAAGAAAPQDGATLWLGAADGVMMLAGSEQRRFDASDGLADDDVRDILIDRAGRKWFATAGGASLYDGAGWTSYFPAADGISSNYVHKVAVDPQERAWFAYGDRGLGVSVKEGARWRQYTAADGLADEHVYSIAFAEDGKTFVGTANGVFQLNKTRWARHGAHFGAPAGKVEALAVAPGGELWAGFAGGVAMYDGETWTTFGPAEGLEIGTVLAIAFDAEGSVWLGAAPSPAHAANGGLFVYDSGVWTAFGMNRTTTVYRGPAAEPLGDWVSGLAFDPAGSLWVGSQAHALAKPLFVHGGVSVYAGDVLAGDTLGDVGWTVYTPDDGLASENVTAVAVDGAGAVWIGTREGLNRVDADGWRTFTTGDGLPGDHITALAPGEGGLWIATAGNGVAWFDGQSFDSITAAGLADRRVNALAEDSSGAIWFATEGGVSRFDGQAWVGYTTLDGLAHNDNSVVAVDGSGAVWAGGAADRATGALLSRFDGEQWRTYTLGDGSLYTRVDAFAVDAEGNPWAVAHYPNQFSSASALFAFDGEQWVQQAGGPGPLGDDRVYALAIDESGALWFGTDGSYDSAPLLAWDGEAWSAYPEAGAGAVFAIVLHGPGRGWLGTENGLLRLDIEPGQVMTRPLAPRQGAVRALAVEPAPSSTWRVREELGGGFRHLAAGPGASLWALAGDRLLRIEGAAVQTIDLPPSLAATAAANGSLAFPTMTDLAVDAQGQPWIATDGHGLYTLAGGRWRQETAAPATGPATGAGLPADAITRLAFDGAGRLWAVFREGGAYSVAYRTDTGWVDATPPDLSDSAPRGLAATADAVWLAAGGRTPFRWQAGEWEQAAANWHGSSFDIAVAANADNVWFGNDAGWRRWSAGGWQDVAGSIPAPFSFPVAVDAHGGAWGIVTPFCYWCRLPDLNENGVIYATLEGACRFTAADGLGGAPLDPPPYVFDPAPARPDAVQDIAVAGDGVVWFVTNGRLTTFTAQGPVCPTK